MNRFLYRLLYWLRRSPWDTGITPPEVTEAFEAGDVPPGPALDLGCGTGTNVIYMAKQGRQATGLDFVPEAIAKAKRKAEQAGVSQLTDFRVADVTRLAEMDLPRGGFALDMGCFHGLGEEGQHRYAEALAGILIPGGRYMLYVLNPRTQAGITFGVLPDTVESVFAPWFDILREEQSAAIGGSTWFWMQRKDGAV